jgi:hypothetical protein
VEHDLVDHVEHALDDEQPAEEPPFSVVRRRDTALDSHDTSPSIGGS